LRLMHKTIKKVTGDISNLSYNTAIAGLMEWYNFLSQQKSVSREEMEIFLKLLAPFAPHVSEELYQLLTPIQSGLTPNKEFSSIHTSIWPTHDPKFLVEEKLIIVVQINGKLRGNIAVDLQTAKDKTKVEELGKSDGNVARHLQMRKIKKVVYIEGKVINFVI
jgi:leucyl-tRNA synthetase